MTNSKFQIESLEIEGFKGVNRRAEFKFHSPLICLFGKNGFGKSTTLEAIEWCLFGDLAYFIYSQPHTKDDIINNFNPSHSAKVVVVLMKDGERYEFTRQKKTGSRKTSFIIQTTNEEFHDEQAEEKRFSLLNLTFDDFYRAVYLHQESIRGLLTDNVASRDEAIDRLLGLNEMRNIVDGIPIRKIKETARKFQDEKVRIDERITGATQQVESELRRFEGELVEYNIAKEEATFETACKITRYVINEMMQISQKYKLEKVDLTTPSNVEEITKILRKIKQLIDLFRRSLIDTSQIDLVAKEKTELMRFKQDFNENQTETSRITEEIRKLEESFGNQKKIKESIEKHEIEVQDLHNKRKELDVKSRIIEDAIQYLEETKVSKCPVCNREIQAEKIIDLLKAQALSYQSDSMKKIDKEIADLKKKKDGLENTYSDLESLYQESKTVAEDSKKLMLKSSEILGKQVDPVDIDSAILRKIEDLDKKIKEFEKTHGDQETRLQQLENDLEKIKIIHKVLEKSEESNKLTERFSEERKESVDLRQKIEELSNLEESFITIIEAINNVQTNLAMQIIKTSASDIDKFYKKICNHPYFLHLTIDVKPRKTAGSIKNSYEIAVFDSDFANAAGSKLSTGQMNSVALAIYLSLSRIFTHNLGFLVLDDPSQSLDTEHQSALIEILKDVTKERRVFISTQDDGFQKLLREKFKGEDQTQVFNFTKITTDGPSVSETSLRS